MKLSDCKCRVHAFQLLTITAAVFFIFLFSNPHPMVHFDYTFRIANELLHGKLGMTETPPDWLNEMVPFEARYYSVFPLGSVLTLLPLVLLKLAGVIDSFPAAFVAASVAAATAAFFFLLSGPNNVSSTRRIILSLFPVLATWTWCNLTFAGCMATGPGLCRTRRGWRPLFYVSRSPALSRGNFLCNGFRKPDRTTADGADLSVLHSTNQRRYILDCLAPSHAGMFRATLRRATMANDY